MFYVTADEFAESDIVHTSRLAHPDLAATEFINKVKAEGLGHMLHRKTVRVRNAKTREVHFFKMGKMR